MDMDQMCPGSVQFLPYPFLSFTYGVNCLVMYTVVFNENVTINSCELELLNKSKTNGFVQLLLFYKLDLVSLKVGERYCNLISRSLPIVSFLSFIIALYPKWLKIGSNHA